MPDFSEGMDRFRGLNFIERKPKYGYLATWIAFPILPKPSKRDTLEAFEQFLDASQASRLKVDPEMKSILSK